MLNKHEVIQDEKLYHDSIASRVKIDNNLMQKFLSFDSPASYMANRLPRLKKMLLQALGDVRGKRVLVYGCGNDSAAVWFSKSGANVDAIDISPRSVDNQKEIAAKLCLNINAIVMDAQSLELLSDEYDIVYGNAILHHLDLHKALPEIVRVLKPKGKAIFRDVMSGNIFLRLFALPLHFGELLMNILSQEMILNYFCRSSQHASCRNMFYPGYPILVLRG
jgi:2-polyprenyl-3-methyl-5-hydroxy-6-metoxy-1,4-benzoquinol methylase